jgi:hypothetical protein
VLSFRFWPSGAVVADPSPRVSCRPQAVPGDRLLCGVSPRFAPTPIVSGHIHNDKYLSRAMSDKVE